MRRCLARRAMRERECEAWLPYLYLPTQPTQPTQPAQSTHGGGNGKREGQLPLASIGRAGISATCHAWLLWSQRRATAPPPASPGMWSDGPSTFLFGTGLSAKPSSRDRAAFRAKCPTAIDISCLAGLNRADSVQARRASRASPIASPIAIPPPSNCHATAMLHLGPI